MIRVAVTGASGDVGSALVHALAESEEIRAVAIVRNTLAPALLDRPDIEVRVGSITDPASAQSLMNDCDAIVNCAVARGNPRQSRLQNRSIVENISAVDPVSRVVHFSSASVYGSCIDDSRSSFDKPRPDNIYGWDKLHVERHAKQHLARASKTYFILRLGHVYGPGQNVTKQIFQNTSSEGFKLPFDGQLPSNAISTLSVCDAVLDMLLGPGDGGVFNLTDRPMLAWREVYDLHTDSWGLPAAEPMNDNRSSSKRDALRKASRRGLLRSLKSLTSRVKDDALLSMSRDHSIRTRIDKMRASFPQSLESRSRAGHLARSVSREIQALSDASPQPPDRLFSDAMPGGYYEIKKGQSPPDTERLPELLRDWHSAVTSYKWNAEESGMRNYQ